MDERKVRDNTPMKRHLITNGDLPVSAGGGKSTIKEKLIFLFICDVLIILTFVLLNFFNIL